MMKLSGMNTKLLHSVDALLNKMGLSLLSLVMFAILATAPYTIGEEYILNLLVVSLMLGTLAMGFDLSAGFIGVANWGYAGLMGLGGYTSALLLTDLGVSPWLGIIAGALLAALVGMIIGLLSLRMDGLFAAILAWFVGLVLMAMTNTLQGFTRGALGLNVDLFFETAWSKPYFYVILVICIITFIVLRLITQSKLGLAFKALGQDPEAARASGVNPLKYKVLNFTISCFIAGLVGGFYAHFTGILTPDVMSTTHTLEILVIAYIGGRGSIWGPLFAAFIIHPVFSYLNSLMEWKLVIYGLLLILVMIYFPGGIASLVEKVQSSIQKLKLKHQSVE